MLLFNVISVIDRYPLQKKKKSSHFIYVYKIYKIIFLLRLREDYFTGIKINFGVAREIEI